MPSSRLCPSEPPGRLSGHPGLCSFCLCEHLCTHSSAPPHLLPWSIRLGHESSFQPSVEGSREGRGRSTLLYSS